MIFVECLVSEGILFHFFLHFIFSLLAPDENPTGIQGYGTEHDNLVISWKVINFFKAIFFKS